MKVQSISSSNTYKARNLPDNLREKISRLRARMDMDVVVLQHNQTKQTIRVRSLDINGEAKFKDGRFLAKRDKNKNLVSYGADVSMIEFGKVKIVSDSSGNILFSKKPLFSKWTTIFDRAGEYIQSALDNYKDDKVIVKQTHKQENLTQEGKNQLEKEYQKIMNVFNKINPFSK